MSEQVSDPYADPRGAGGAEGPSLRVVPDLPQPLGAGVLPAQEALDQDMVVRRVVPVTHDVVTMVLEPTRPGGLAFRPGQYVVLGLEVDGVWTERCYTVSSPPTRPHLLTVTVKRMPGGEMSEWLHGRARVGDRVSVRGPLGEFSVTEHPARRYLLLSAGSGVTPTLATLRTMADLADPTDVVVVHSARTPADLVCRSELEALAAESEGLRVHWVCEEDPCGDWSGPRGRLTDDLLATLVPDLPEREVLTCGPPGYMRATRATLARLGADPARCHEESFVLGAVAAPTAPQVAVPEQVVDPALGARVRFGRSGREVRCAPGATVLEAAAQAGVVLPSSCSAGLCGTCTSTLLSGKVEMHHHGGIRPREIAQDKFLPCCSTPDGDIVVDA